MGTLLAVQEINEAGGINGRELQIVSYDPESRPARFAALAEKLILEDGCISSSAATCRARARP